MALPLGPSTPCEHNCTKSFFQISIIKEMGRHRAWGQRWKERAARVSGIQERDGGSWAWRGGSGEAEKGRTLENLTTGEPVESSGELGVKSEGTRGMKTGFENFGLSN